MRRAFLAIVVVILARPCAGAEEGARTSLLRVLYVGNKDSARERAYARFLDERFILVDSVARSAFDPESARAADVVLLDWSMSDLGPEPAGGWSVAELELRPPLGERRAWSRPTVLLGSAGHLLAVPWKVFGGSGWAGLEPYAYDLRDHPVFRQPIPIDRSRLVRRPWPEAWPDGDRDEEIKVLALVAAGRKPAQPGWCTSSVDMDDAPDVEVLCGGLNPRARTAAAVWRQGNLLHFGFDLSPDEMNPAGKALLVNAIAYIARFGDDRPIMETPSPFTGNVPPTRTALARTIARDPAGAWDYLRTRFDPAALEAGGTRNLKTFARWYPSVQGYLHPAADGTITVDDDARTLGLKPARRAFFDRAIALLRLPGDDAARARLLLARYAPDGPGPEATSRQWTDWLEENEEYLFFADAGGYRWYIDPLARDRGKPTEKLRGVARASR
jgi:hypothetical protein